MIPARTVKQLAAELPGTLDIRIARVMQNPGGRYNDIVAIASASTELELPSAINKFSAGSLLAETDELVQTEFFRRALKIGQHLRPGRQVPSPVGVALERVGVVMTGYVAGQPGIGVLAPGATDTVGLFINGDIPVAGLLQSDAGQYAGHTRTQYHDPELA